MMRGSSYFSRASSICSWPSACARWLEDGENDVVAAEHGQLQLALPVALVHRRERRRGRDEVDLSSMAVCLISSNCPLPMKSPGLILRDGVLQRRLRA